MRRAIGDRWPALSAYFGLHPWDVDRLSYREIEHYTQALADLPPIGSTFIVSPKG